jgi:uncharacterized protein (DUF433 family)
MALQERQDLIDHWIESNPSLSGPHEARLVEYGIPVWALIAHLRVVDDPRRVATDYDLPTDAIDAVLAYYRQHRALIDARIALNEAAFEG